MLLHRNLRRISDNAARSWRVLTFGAGADPLVSGALNAARQVIEAVPIAQVTAKGDGPAGGRFPFVNRVPFDICAAPWPFPDKHFDFSFCSHLLEDVRDPLVVLRELSRVSRAGYIETPSRAREIFLPTRFPRLAAWLGRTQDVGFAAHRWYVEYVEGEFRFLAKTPETVSRPHYVLTRGELGRDLSEDESGLGVFWTERIDGRELTFPDAREVGYELRGFKQRILYHLKTGDAAPAMLSDAWPA